MLIVQKSQIPRASSTSCSNILRPIFTFDSPNLRRQLLSDDTRTRTIETSIPFTSHKCESPSRSVGGFLRAHRSHRRLLQKKRRIYAFLQEDSGFYDRHGILRAQVPLGCGLAFAQKYKKDGIVTFALYNMTVLPIRDSCLRLWISLRFGNCLRFWSARIITVRNCGF